MNRSADEVDEVPVGVVTVTSTVPEADGAWAVIDVAELTVTPVAAVVPNFTPVAPVKPEPVIVTVLVATPLDGLMPDTEGRPLLETATICGPDETDTGARTVPVDRVIGDTVLAFVPKVAEFAT